MKKIATAFLSAAMLCALLAAPALAWDRDDYPAWRGRDGWYEQRYDHERFENRPYWAWNNRAEWREHHDWDDFWRRGDGDDHWRAPHAWYYRGYDRH